MIDIGRYVVLKPVGVADTLGGNSYIHPYRQKIFHSRADIFPNIINDTLFISFNRKLQIRDFSFDFNNKLSFRK